jgi:hypothetical protein
MSSNDDTYLTSLRTHAAETGTLFSNPMKPERERTVVRAYLRCLGIPFTEDEIASSNDEPVLLAGRNLSWLRRSETTDS